MSTSLIVLIFFFQAEDGIRDGRVTGVQTCALPICLPLPRPPQSLPPPATPERRTGSHHDHRRSAPCKAPSNRRTPHDHRIGAKIGRASCRERVEIAVGAETFKKKNKRKSK